MKSSQPRTIGGLKAFEKVSGASRPWPISNAKATTRTPTSPETGFLKIHRRLQLANVAHSLGHRLLLLQFRAGPSLQHRRHGIGAGDCGKWLAVGLRWKFRRFDGRPLPPVAAKRGGKVTGITPQLMVDKGLSDTLADELVVTNDMRDRKALLESRGDAFVALPGGLGTYEEIFEIIVGRQLGYHDKPIVLLNVGDYHRPLLQMVEHGITQRFIKAAARDLFFVAGNVEEAIDRLKQNVPRVRGRQMV